MKQASDRSAMPIGPDGDTVREMLDAASEILTTSGADSPRFDAEVLLAHILDTKPGIIASPLPPRPTLEQTHIFYNLLELRRRGMPLNYVVGTCEFMGLTFRCDSRALSPRHESELAAEILIEQAKAHGGQGWLVDVGCGSGVLGLSAGYYLPDVKVTGCDISAAALELFSENAALLDISARVQAVQSSFLDWLSSEAAGKVRYLVSNPPYVREAIYPTLQREIVEYEPKVALVAPTVDGLGAYREMAARLSEMTQLEVAVFEVGYDQAAVSGIMIAARPDMAWNLKDDYGGNQRMVIGIRQ